MKIFTQKLDKLIRVKIVPEPTHAPNSQSHGGFTKKIFSF